MVLNFFLAISTALNFAFFTGFLFRYTELRKQIKKHSYSSGTFRKIDEDKRGTFLVMVFYIAFNVVILIWALYEINN